MMLGDRLDEQTTLFKEILFKKLTVREAEAISRRIAYDKIRKKGAVLDPETQELEEKLTESLGTRVSIEKRENGGKILIDFFSNEDLQEIFNILNNGKKASSPTEMMDRFIEKEVLEDLDDRTPEEKAKDENAEEDMYSIKNFSI